MITSASNPTLKLVRKLLAQKRKREELGLFVGEGEDLAAAAAAAGSEPIERLVAGETVEAELLGAISTLPHPARIVCVYRTADLPREPRETALALWGVGDPGNVGTVLRSALAFGASSVVLGPGTADPYGPKAVRASMGAIFAVPVVRASNIGELPGHKVALVARTGRALPEVDAQEVTLVVGAEREGLPGGVLASCNETAHIPIRSESLNAGVAAIVALYEVGRMAGHA